MTRYESAYVKSETTLNMLNAGQATIMAVGLTITMLLAGRGIADGSIRHLDSQSTATILWASWNGIISLAWRHDDLRLSPEQVAELIERAADLVSYGLRLR